MRRKRFGVAVALVAVLAFAATALGSAQSTATPKFGKCKPTGKYNSVKLPKTISSDTLTVGLTQLSPRTYKGNTLGSVNDGYNYCLAANLAWRAGLHKIKLVKVDFAQLVVGRLKNFDVAIDDIYIKPERQKKVDFSIPYGHSWTAVSALASNPITQSNMKDLKFAVTLGSVQQKYLDDVVKPTKQYATYDTPVEMFAALQAKQVDAVLIDVPVALPYAADSHGVIKVYAQIKAGGIVGVVMQKGTPDRIPINTMLKQMLANGTVKALEKKYYFAAYGGIDPDTLPVWG
jgi:polar amino acid transport system substrate-binding protein